MARRRRKKRGGTERSICVRSRRRRTTTTRRKRVRKLLDRSMMNTRTMHEVDRLPRRAWAGGSE